jgi:hypothetical protein
VDRGPQRSGKIPSSAPTSSNKTVTLIKYIKRRSFSPIWVHKVGLQPDHLLRIVEKWAPSPDAQGGVEVVITDDGSVVLRIHGNP